jgi:hypothetical protein
MSNIPLPARKPPTQDIRSNITTSMSLILLKQQEVNPKIYLVSVLFFRISEILAPRGAGREDSNHRPQPHEKWFPENCAIPWGYYLASVISGTNQLLRQWYSYFGNYPMHVPHLIPKK